MNDIQPQATKPTLQQQDIVSRAQQKVVESRVPWAHSSRRTRILIFAYLLLFVLFLALAWFVHVYPVLPVDIAITREFQENQNPWLKGFMLAISYLGNQDLLFAALILGTAAFFWIVRLRLEALFIIAHSIISGVLNVLIKYIVSRPRPTANLVDIFQHAAGQSFPSGHVMSYVAYWGLLFSFGLILLKRDRWWHFLILLVPALFVVLVGPSRIYLGSHWASDVVGGYMFGGLLLGLTLWLYLTLKERGVLAPKTQKADERLVEPARLAEVPRPRQSI